jgi:hypothetical protein
MINIFFFENLTVYEIKWKNVVEPGRPHDSIIRRTRVACWITGCRRTIRIRNTYCFPVQQWLLELPTLRYVYIAKLFSIIDRPFI